MMKTTENQISDADKKGINSDVKDLKKDGVKHPEKRAEGHRRKTKRHAQTARRKRFEIGRSRRLYECRQIDDHERSSQGLRKGRRQTGF